MSIRHEYEKNGVINFYKDQGLIYRNPHVKALQNGFSKFIKDIDPSVFKNVLDFGCGSGEISEILKRGNIEVEGADPYTSENYIKNTQLNCYQYSFDDVNKLKSYSCVVFSYCLHLMEESKLPVFLYNLSLKTDYMIIVSPHKKPFIDSSFWILKSEMNLDRVKYRLFVKKEIV